MANPLLGHATHPSAGCRPRDACKALTKTCEKDGLFVRKIETFQKPDPLRPKDMRADCDWRRTSKEAGAADELTNVPWYSQKPTRMDRTPPYLSR